jgi:hypothetical protein
VLLLVALAAALAASRPPSLLWADRLALAYGGIVVVYWLLPQSWLDGEATARGELYALRHHLLPLGAYVLGRLLPLDRAWWRRIGLTLVGLGCALAVWGLVDVYLVPLGWWRDSGVPGWFAEQLGLAYECLSGLPENWILNTDEESPVRRLVSTFLSPLATSYTLVVVLLLLAAARPRRWTVAAVPSRTRAPLDHTRARSSRSPRAWSCSPSCVGRGRAVLAAGSIVVSLAFVAVFPAIGPGTAYTATSSRACARDAALEGRRGQRCARSGRELDGEHWRALRDGIRTVAEHPWGFGSGGRVRLTHRRRGEGR